MTGMMTRQRPRNVRMSQKNLADTERYEGEGVPEFPDSFLILLCHK